VVVGIDLDLRSLAAAEPPGGDFASESLVQGPGWAPNPSESLLARRVREAVGSKLKDFSRSRGLGRDGLIISLTINRKNIIIITILLDLLPRR
jgi:hypothetical protein